MKFLKKIKTNLVNKQEKRRINGVAYGLLVLSLVSVMTTGCTKEASDLNTDESLPITEESSVYKNKDLSIEDASKENTETSNATTTESNSENTDDMFDGYKIIEVDGGDLSGHREPNVAVDIGFGDREYWAFTNEYGQLVKVVAKEIVLQDDSKEPVNSNGRYYPDEAKVPGVESKDLDEGHVILL